MNYQLGQTRSGAPLAAAAHHRGNVAAWTAHSALRQSSAGFHSPRHGGAVAHATKMGGALMSPAFDAQGGDDIGGMEPLVIGTAMNNLTTAIQAYAAPLTGMEFSCRGENGTLTQFLCPEFVKENFKALLRVKVKSGTGFDDADMFSKPDLFVKLSAGDSYAQTETIKDKRNPVWDESFIMWPEQYGEDDLMGDVAEGPPVLKVTVFDEDWGFGKTVDDRLGNAEIQLPDDWETLDNVDYTVDIKDKDDKVVGQIYLTIDAFSLDESAKQEGARKAAGEAGEASSVAAAAFASMKPKHGLKPGDSANLARSVAAAAVIDPNVAGRMAKQSDESGDATLVPVDEVADEAAEEANEAFIRREKLYKAWDALGKAFPDAFISDGEPVVFINAKHTSDVQAFVHRNQRLKQVVVAFRGSQSIADWTTDGSFALEAITADPVTGAMRTMKEIANTTSGGILQEIKKLLPLKDAAVHVGFYYAMRTVEPQIREAVDMITGGDPTWEVTITGHSLGAALAVSCAYSLATSCNFNYPLECYAYGCPRIGNLGFVKEYNLAVPRTFQVQVDNDVVAQLPPFLGYKDVSNECRIMDGGRLEVPEGMPLSLFGVQPLSDAVRERLVMPLTAEEDRNKKQRSEADGQLFQAILSMEGGTPHLPDTYLKAMSEVMVTASSGERFEDSEAVQMMRDAFAALYPDEEQQPATA